MGVPAKTLFTWQAVQATVVCAPVSGNGVLEWSKVAPAQLVVVWQVSHVVGNPAAACAGLLVPL